MNRKVYEKKDGYKMNYLVYFPDDVKDLPLIVYLHGAGERGDKWEHLFRHGLARLLNEGREYPAVVLCPQCPAPFIWNNVVADLKEIIDSVVAEYGIKRDRILLTGSSMGGYGTWETAMCYPETFAAIAPVAGGGVAWRSGKLKDIPVRAYHGTADTCVEYINSEIMVNGVNERGGKAELISLSGLEHNDGIDYAYRETDLMDWLLSHRKTDFSRVPEFCEEWF